MRQRLRRIRGAVGIGSTWAVAWGGAGAIMSLVILLVTGSRPDPPFPLMLGAFGFVAGVIFSGVLGFVEGHRRFDEMSIPRFAAWGSAVGFLLVRDLCAGRRFRRRHRISLESTDGRPHLRDGRRRLCGGFVGPRQKGGALETPARPVRHGHPERCLMSRRSLAAAAV